MLLSTATWSCVNAPDYPTEPVIEYLAANKTTIAQGNAGARPDTLLIRFSFTDGDGDIGFESDSLDVFLTDSRDGFVELKKLPVIPREGAGNGISGNISLRIPNTPFRICCTFPNGATACQPNEQFLTDTFSYAIQIRDRSNNFSNKIRTETFTILCN